MSPKLYYRYFYFCLQPICILHSCIGSSPRSISVIESELRFPSQTSNPASEQEEVLPITSYACQWKAPKKRKENSLPFSEANFHKHVYGKQRKRALKPLEDFEPRPAEFRGTAKDGMPQLLDKLCSKGLCISLSLDEKTRFWTNQQPSTSDLTHS